MDEKQRLVFRIPDRFNERCSDSSIGVQLEKTNYDKCMQVLKKCNLELIFHFLFMPYLLFCSSNREKTQDYKKLFTDKEIKRKKPSIMN